MDTQDLNAPESISWPSTLSAQQFLDQHWQKKPLLLRQAFPDFETPITPDELAGLSLDEDTTPRIITLDDEGKYHLEHGPFKDDRFETLTGNDWSLLVTDIEKHCPELMKFLKPFQFIPNWRIDDIMISYAPEGASVGAHVDEYDVFLLQASGTRKWMIDSSENPDLTIVPGATLKLLENFNATDHYELIPGDMLYLPPGVPHHGIAASENCTTWSIGFRAPALSDVVLGFAEFIADKLEAKRYEDPALNVASPGQLDQQTLTAFATLWRDAVDLSDEELATLTARALTTPTVDVERAEYQESELTDSSWVKHPFSRIAFIENNGLNDGEGDMVSDAEKLIMLSKLRESRGKAGTGNDGSKTTGNASASKPVSAAANEPKISNGDVTLFADSQQMTCSLKLAKALTNNEAVLIEDLDAVDAAVVKELVLNGSLSPAD